MNGQKPAFSITLGSICRLDTQVVDSVSNHWKTGRMSAACCAVICAGTMLYGAAFGLWRSPLQSVYSAIKMPILFFSVVAASGMANAFLSQVMGAGLSCRQVVLCILLSMAMSAALLGSLSPVAVFFVFQLSSSSAPDAVSVYPVLLAAHTAVVGLCGTIGTIRLYRLLQKLIVSTTRVRWIIFSWFCVSGFVGCELSWMLSPFLANPCLPEPFINPSAFSGNFFEYLWAALMRGI